ncbi:MAG: hypothetical protein AAGB48_08085 [Planctomycetota bacterium]
MATSQRTINQVRSILGRLDRSIDEARQRRLHGDEPEPAIGSEGHRAAADTNAPERPGTSAASGSGHASSNGSTHRQPTEASPPPVGPKRASPRAPSPFGRAKPLRKTGSEGEAGW